MEITILKEGKRREIMENIAKKIAVALVTMMISTTSVAFAADPIEINYSGGSRIDDVARVSEYEVNHLFQINRQSQANTTYFGGPWTEANWQNGNDIPGRTVTIPVGTKIWEDTGFVCDREIEVDGEYYDMRVTLVKTVNNTPRNASFFKRYSGSNVDVWAADIPSSLDNMIEGVFCSCDVELIKDGSDKKLELEDLWFCLSDLDCSQSFSSSNIDLSPSNMLIKRKGQFIGYENGSDTIRTGDGYINETGIYSTPWTNVPTRSIGDVSDVFMRVSGLNRINLIFGFHSPAGSAIGFFTTKNKVEYKSVNGKITGIASENVLKGGLASGSKQEPDEGYSFVRWTSSVDITLNTGEKIPQGEVISEEQIKKAVISRDTVFTAYNDPVYEILTEVVNGTITPSESNIPEGQNRTVIYQPNSGCQLKKLTVDEEEKNINEFPTSFSFENINGNHIVKAEYEKIPVLEITKKADKRAVNPGDTVTYTVTVRQTVEGAEARDVVIRDELPEGLILNEDSIKGDLKIVSKSPTGYELSIDSLQNEITYMYTAVTDAEKEESELTNVVMVRAGNVPGDPLKAKETIASLIPKPVLSKQVSNEEPINGEEITYTISAKEPQEGISVKNVEITDRIPDGIEYVDGSLQAAGDDAKAEIIEDVIKVTADKMSGEIIITFKAKVLAASGNVVNKAVLKMDGFDDLDSEAIITVKDESVPMNIMNETEPDPVRQDPGQGVKGSSGSEGKDAASMGGEKMVSGSKKGKGSTPGTGDLQDAGSMLFALILLTLSSLLGAGIFMGFRVLRRH